MDKLPTNNEAEQSRYNSLKEKLLTGQITVEAFRDQLVLWDQETSSREASEENLVLLNDPQIKEYIEQHTETRRGYFNLLSLTEFHVAQRLAKLNQVEAVIHLRKALEYSLNGYSDKSWTSYVRGTLLYMEGKEIPQDLIDASEPVKNSRILKNLNNGLRRRGTPSYTEDYFE